MFEPLTTCLTGPLLLHSPSVKLAIGLGTTAALGIIIGIILCVVLKVRGGKKAHDRKRSGRKSKCVFINKPLHNYMYSSIDIEGF